MVDLASLPNPKQLIQLRMCLSLETQRVLEHTLQVSPDFDSSIEEILDVLQKHVKDFSNEALRSVYQLQAGCRRIFCQLLCQAKGPLRRNRRLQMPRRWLGVILAQAQHLYRCQRRRTRAEDYRPGRLPHTRTCGDDMPFSRDYEVNRFCFTGPSRCMSSILVQNGEEDGPQSEDRGTSGR